MPANSTQKLYRLSTWIALAGFIGCRIFSLFYFYKEKQLAEQLKTQASKIRKMELQCTAAHTARGHRDCAGVYEQTARLHGDRMLRQAYQDQVMRGVWLALGIPLFCLLASCWWHWVRTGRFFARRRSGK